MADLRAETLTGDDLLKMPSGMGERYELIDGELITMTTASFLHGLVALQSGFLLKSHTSQRKIGRVLGAETGFYTRGDKKTVRAPDVAYISYQKLPAGPLPAETYLDIAPDLVVEVVSPGDRAGEIEQKIQEWLNFGVRLVWVVYPESKRVHVYAGHSDQSRILTVEDAITGGDVLPEFEVPVSAFFED